MKNYKITASSILFGAILLSMNANASTAPAANAEVEIPMKALLSPEYGFETKNIIQVVLYGTLPNQCYTLSNSVVEKLRRPDIYLVKQFATHDTKGVCADENTMPDQMKAPVPFTNPVNIGHVTSGNYTFLWRNEAGTLERRPVVVSEDVVATVDTLPYAAVSGLSAPDSIQTTDHLWVTLTGALSTTCTQLNPNVKLMNENDVEVVMPTITVQSGICGMIMTYFTKNVDLGVLSPGIHLIYVRSMSGQAYSKVVTVN